MAEYKDKNYQLVRAHDNNPNFDNDWAGLDMQYAEYIRQAMPTYMSTGFDTTNADFEFSKEMLLKGESEKDITETLSRRSARHILTADGELTKETIASAVKDPDVIKHLSDIELNKAKKKVEVAFKKKNTPSPKVDNSPKPRGMR